MKKYLIHSIGWLVYLTFLFVLLTIYTDSSTAIIKTSSIGGVQFVIFYFNLFLISRNFNKKMSLFIGTNIILLALGILICEYLSQLTPMENSYEYYDTFEDDKNKIESLDMIKLQEMKYDDYYDFENTFIHGFPIILIQFFSFLVYTNGKRKKEEQKELALIKAEKSFLKQQMNPHFLFNVLNNIYSLSIDNDPKTSEAIMQLSNLLSYSLYGEKKGKVSLGEEVKNITSFIDLFMLKDDDIEGINFVFNEINKSLKMTSMLLLPFVENAFKHSNIESKSGFITIELSSEENELTFLCSNSYNSMKSVDENGGIGIENIKRSLHLIYPKHKLTIKDSGDKC